MTNRLAAVREHDRQHSFFGLRDILAALHQTKDQLTWDVGLEQAKGRDHPVECARGVGKLGDPAVRHFGCARDLQFRQCTCGPHEAADLPVQPPGKEES